VTCSDPGATAMPPTGSGCDLMNISGTGITQAGADVAFTTTPVAKTLTAGRCANPNDDECKNIFVVLTDAATNPNTGTIEDDIDLDATVTITPIAPKLALWEITVVNWIATVTNGLATDHVKGYFSFDTTLMDDTGHGPVQCDQIDGSGVANFGGKYFAGSFAGNDHELKAKLYDDSECSDEEEGEFSPVLDNAGSEISNTLNDQVTVVKHDVDINAELLFITPQAERPYALFADIEDFHDPIFVIPQGITVNLSGSGVAASTALPGEVFTTDPVTETIVVTDNFVAELESGDVTGITKSGGLIKIHAGTTFNLVGDTDTFRLDLGTGERRVDFTFVDGEGNLNGPHRTLPPGPGRDAGVLAQDGDNVRLVTITNIVGGGTNPTVGFERISLRNLDDRPIADISSSSIPNPSGANTLLLQDGTVYSQGIMPSAQPVMFDFIFDYTGNVDYKTARQTISTTTVPNEEDLGGIGSSAAVRDDSGRGRTAIDCTRDTDADGFCEEETMMGSGVFEEKGLPYTVDRTLAAGAITEHRIPIPSSFVVDQQDAWVEVDYMLDHAPFGDGSPTSLPLLVPDNGIFGDIQTVFSDNGKNIVFDVDDALPFHEDFLFVWTKFVASNRMDNFECIKADWFGESGQRPTIGGAPSPSVTLQNAPQFFKTMTIYGIRLTTPTDPNLNGDDDTQGVITVKQRINTLAAVTSISLGTPVIADSHPFGPMWFGTVTATATQIDTTKWEITFEIPFLATNDFTNLPIGGVSVNMLFGPVKSSSIIGNTPCSTKVTSTLIDAKALSSRYLLIGHGMGGSTGQAEFNGNDLVMTMADLGSMVDGHPKGTEKQEQGTVMHELGHSLGLQHGGLDNVNCKVNNGGNMPYSRQMPTPYMSDSTWKLDYSHGDLGSIDENNLPEFEGRPRSADATMGAGHTLPLNIVYANPNPAYLTLPIFGPFSTLNINWNGDGEIANTSPMGGQDPNDFNTLGCQDSAGEPEYFDGDEWGGLDFIFTDTASGFFDGTFITGFGELTGVVIQEGELQTSNPVWNKGLSPDGFGKKKVNTTFNIKFSITASEVNGGGILGYPEGFVEVYDEAGAFVVTLPDLEFELGKNPPHHHTQWTPTETGIFFGKILLNHPDNPTQILQLFDDDNLYCISSAPCEISEDGMVPEDLMSFKMEITQKGGKGGGQGGGQGNGNNK